MRDLRLGQRIRVDGRVWTVAMLYRPDRQVLVERDGERQMIDWPGAGRSGARTGGRRPCDACGRVFARRSNNQKYCGRDDCYCECGGAPVAVKGRCRGCCRLRGPRDPAEFAAIRRDIYADMYGGRYWTRERIVRALQQWAARHDGRAPSTREWNRRRRVRRHANGMVLPGSRPGAGTVAAVFGSWRAALEAAGLEVRRSGFEPLARCRRGHEFTPENTMVWRGTRKCRTCANKQAKRRPPIELTCPDCGETREVEGNGRNRATAAAGGVRRCVRCAGRARWRDAA